MANPEHLAILQQGVEEWKKWRLELRREGKHDLTPDLTGAYLERALLNQAELGGVDLRGAVLQDSDLRKAELHWSNLSGAVLDGANLAGAKLVQAVFNRAYLKNADLTASDLGVASLAGADLHYANLSGANLDGTDFAGAELGGTVFADVDLSAAQDLETAVHSWPSTVGIDTIYKSSGKIPEVFLRGCGVPEEFIAYIGSMVGRPIEYYSCFISYSTKDQVFADRLYADLQAKGVRCWFAPHEMKAGRKIHEQIDEAIRVHDKLLLILSEHSMASDWVGTEIANAREREEREKKQMLFPITIAPFEEVKQWKKFDADRGTDSAREIREYYIPDFSGWERDHGGYQREFEKLVSALKNSGQ